MSTEEQLPIFRNTRVVVFGEIRVDSGSRAVFEPWMDDPRENMGWTATIDEGVTYLYIAPVTDNPRGSEATFYLFVGPYGDPAKDRRLGPYNMEGDT